jgi:hypothetical protein
LGSVLVVPASMAGLLEASACVGVGPPLKASAPSCRFPALTANAVAELSLARLKPPLLTEPLFDA